MKIVLIGAGSAQFGYGTMGDIFQSKALAGAHISLVDINEAALEKVRATAAAFVEKEKLPFAITASTDRRKELSGADFVIISIEVGNRFELWDQDWTIPRQFGIRQVYGENGGPGGLFHALRIVPPILDIMKDVEELCPSAFVFCYSNPMTAITTTVLRRFPKLRFVGLCHEIASLERYLPDILGVPFPSLSLRAAGLNHFSVLLDAKYADGRDAYPDIRAKAPAFFEREPGYSDALAYFREHGSIPETEGSLERILRDKGGSARPWTDRTLFKVILERYGLLPITGDSHLGEYIGWAASCADDKGILDFYALYRAMLAQADRAKIDLNLKERVVPIMEGIAADSGYEEAAVNVLNDGLIPDLPASVAVEVPARIGKDGPRGIAFPDYPKGFAALLRNYCGVYDLTAEAILTGKRDYVIQALLASPVVDDCRRLDDMVDLFLERQAKWLGYIK